VEIYTAEQVKRWDQFTIENEPVSSIDLMERAATRCVEWIGQHRLQKKPFLIFCGKGNNGGDGLAIARLLLQRGVRIEVFILEFGKMGSTDFQTNLLRLHELPVAIHFLQDQTKFPEIPEEAVIIDALFGSGLNKPLDGHAAALVTHINRAKALVVSVDIPSGLFIDQSSVGNPVVRADHTLTFQVLKLPFLFQENAPFIGSVHLLDIGLHPGFGETETPLAHLVDQDLAKTIYRPRNRFAHKGAYGHALVVGGSYGKIGAVLLATQACLRSGAGLTTTYLPKCGYPVLQSEAPEAMALTDEDPFLISTPPSSLEKVGVVGIGPGLGTDEKTVYAIGQLLAAYNKPLVIDADGLNCLALNPDLLSGLPSHSILTPHPKEFERLFGACVNDYERMSRAREKARSHHIVIVLKGHHSLIATPSGQLYFNTTGNAGMAKGGSGDVLTGIITALVAQGYQPLLAALLGVYLHGAAGDLAAKQVSPEAMIASDIINNIGTAFLQLSASLGR
jgi:ADP-dependent NAD(P)H-hydrate dehydratase / NAD(P)H-hydrate epimerase